MLPVWSALRVLFGRDAPREKQLRQAIRQITGRTPRNLGVYKLALLHTSAARDINPEGIKESNERMEFLGDAVLGAVVAEYLFKRYPYKDEGFLTEIRSRIVNRESLNGLSRKIGLHTLVEFDNNRRNALAFKSMHGDALEAFVGAVFLDQGYPVSRRFIVQQLLPHFDLEKIVLHNPNFKSLVIEWAQREGRRLRFEVSEKVSGGHREFIAQVVVDDALLSTGGGMSKKKAEQSAAEKACDQLKLK